MPIFCRHRVNQIEELRALPADDGVELDVRDSGTDLVLAHDPWNSGPGFSTYLQSVGSRFIIVNVKSEGVETRAREQLARAGVENYFFLDLSFPALVKLAGLGEKRLCCRFSKFEPKEYVRAARPLVSWVWADYLHGEGISPAQMREFQDWGLKVCLVSPELVGKSEEETRRYAAGFRGVSPDMVCTKHVTVWKGLLR